MNNIMSKITKSIKLMFNVPSDKKHRLNCNYSNNYYGDQYCQSKGK